MSRSRRHLLREVLLTTGAVVGTLCVLAALAGHFLGVTPVVFRSGSMAPAVETGDLGVVRSVPLDTLRDGDIVSVVDERGVRITHRLVSVEMTGNSATLVLKGDANESPDPQPYVVTRADRMLFAVPHAGYVVAWLSGPIGVVLGGLLVGVVLLVVFRRRRDTDEGPRHRSNGSVGPVTLAVLVVVLASALPSHAASTLAAWTDTAPITGVGTTAYTVPATSIASCANTPLGTNPARHVTLTWPGVTAPGTSYAVTLAEGSGTFSATSITISGTTTKTADIQYDASVAANRNKLVTATVTPSLAATPPWTGGADTWKFQTASNSAQATCQEKVAPVVAITAPDGTTRTSAAEITYMGSASGCANNGRPACGTMSDASAVTVDYVLQRVQLGVTTCWSGTAYVADCSFRAASMPSTTTWRVGGQNSVAYATPGGAYTLTVRATDLWGAQTTVTRTFTVTP